MKYLSILSMPIITTQLKAIVLVLSLQPVDTGFLKQTRTVTGVTDILKLCWTQYELLFK